jgi:hypothetical protein
LGGPGSDVTRTLAGVPFWQEVYHTERRAGAIVDAFTPYVKDPLVRKAVALQGVEESRHAQLIRVMIDRYGLDATEQPLEVFPDDLETTFIDFRFGECLDAFLGFGAFKTARQSSFLPETMFQIFDVLMLEETRHIVFFINYMAWSESAVDTLPSHEPSSPLGSTVALHGGCLEWYDAAKMPTTVETSR